MKERTLKAFTKQEARGTFLRNLVLGIFLLMIFSRMEWFLNFPEGVVKLSILRTDNKSMEECAKCL